MSFWTTLLTEGIKKITSSKPAPVKSMEFKVGEGLTPEQKTVAETTVRNPDQAMQEGKASSFWGRIATAVPGPAERLGAITQSVKSKSLEPLKASFKDQFSNFNPAQDVATATNKDLPMEERKAAFDRFASPVIGATSGLSKLGNIAKSKASKETLNYFAKTNTIEESERALKQLGIDDVTAKEYAPKLAATRTVDEVKDVLIGTEKQTPRYATSQPKSLPANLQREADEIQLRKEVLAENPLNQLTKYVDKKTGTLPEAGVGYTGRFPNAPKNIFQARGDEIVSREDFMRFAEKGGYIDSNTIRAEYDNFIRSKKELREMEKDFNIRKREALKELKAKPAHLKFDSEGNPLAYTAKEKAIIERSNVPEATPIDTTTGEGRSLEIVARQARDMIAPEKPSIPEVSLPKVIEKTITPVKQKVHLIDTYLTTPKFVMEKIGLGPEYKMLRDATDNYWKELPKNLDVIKGWIKKAPSAESNKNIFRWLDGEAIDLLPAEKEVAIEIRKWLQDWAKRLGLPEDRQISHYITHIFDKEIVAGEFDEELAKIIADRVPGQVYDPFLEKRLGAKGYKQDTWAALDAYIKRATRKVNMDPALETIKEKTGSTLATSKIEKSQFQYVQKYIDNINIRPSNFDEGFDNFLKSILGTKAGPRPSLVALSSLRRLTFRAMLGLNPASALRNLSQGINTFAVLGPKKTFAGYMKLFSKGAGDELEREGILNSGFIQDRALSSFKKKIEAFDKTLFYLFDKAEKINRGSAYFGAKSKALSEGMSEEEAIDYAKKVVRQTQFAFDTVDTPVGMASNMAKTMTQFQTFTTKQIEFLVQLAKNKQYAALMRYTLGGLMFVYTIGKAFGMKPEELIPSFRFDTPPSLKFPVEVTKAALNTPDKYNQPRDLKQKATDIGKSLIGLIPFGSQIKKTYEGINAIKDSGSFDKSGKLQYLVEDTTTAKIQAVLFGKYASQNAQNYFNKAENTAKEEAKLQPVYDKVQALVMEGKEDEAQAIVDELSDADYETYKNIKTKALTEKTLQGKKDILPTYLEVKKLIKDGKKDEAQAIVDGLTDDQYKYYDLVKKQVEKDTKALNGEVPEYENNEPQTEKGLVNTVFTYAKAVGVDPVTAFNRIFTGQRIRYVSNGTIVVERMPLVKSQAVKEERGGNNITMKLDHTLPLELGGSNAESNLQLVPTEVWKSYTPVENALGKALRLGKIDKKTAQNLITNFKKGDITSEYVLSQIQ